MLPTPAPLTGHLGYWLRLVSNQVSHSFARRLAEHDVTTAEWVVLRELYDAQALAPSRLADRLGLTRGAVSKLADRLIAKALLARAAHESDGRAHTLALTPRGRALVPALAATADANDAQFFGHLAPDQRRALEETLREIVARQGLSAHPID
ncbi:MarR family winged helix-turn-helix transcriptional regulator [Ancylobacter sp. G4_0304]|uniref:MarR family winged helix-turn-helix transcriptional regulator n=1 Tax=Ancylobacter sp. G4_0304 TaxID=3114289 RepID=UPI0039C65768